MVQGICPQKFSGNSPLRIEQSEEDLDERVSYQKHKYIWYGLEGYIIGAL